MASGMYERKPRKLDEFRSYGYKKVTHSELKEIVERMQKKTYTSNIYHGELFHRVPSPPRPPSSTCPKAPKRGDEAGKRQRQRMSDRDLNRLTRRLCRPTISKLANQGRIVPEYELDRPPTVQPTRHRTAKEKKKAMEHLTRPTTASRSKLYGQCVFCGDPQMEEYMDIDFSDDKMASQDEIDSIIRRARTPTIASEGGIHECVKIRTCSRGGSRPHSCQPVVSGLSRSKNTDEIVERLHRPYSSPAFRNRTPKATPITY